MFAEAKGSNRKTMVTLNQHIKADEEPGTNALIIVQIQGLTSQIVENLSKIKPKPYPRYSINIVETQEQTVAMAKEEIGVFQRLTLLKLQKAFE